MNKRAFNFLVKLAKEKANPISYSDLCLKCNVLFSANDTKLFKLLEELTTEDVKFGRPLLSSFVVRKATSKPESGFYDLCLELKHENFLKYMDDKTFEKKERDECYNYWENKELPN